MPTRKLKPARLGPNPEHTIQERCRWLALRHCRYRQQALKFKETLLERGAVAVSPMYWTDEECREFLGFAKVAPHLRKPY